MAITKPLYQKWIDMKRRCDNPKRKDYKNYGGRGIRCMWVSYEDFILDMYPTYKKGLQLDRIDNNGNYCKENCRWANQVQQANNTRKNRNIFFKGEIHSLSQWAKILGIKRSTLSMRYYVYKFPIAKCFNKN